jgi:hypothetical protein
MRRFIRLVTLALLAWTAVSVGVAEAATERFSGDKSARTGVFAFDGPWMLDWSVSSDYPLAAEFEMRLLDAETERVIGTILQIEGAANGVRLFPDPGKFRIEVVASYVNWTLEVESVSTELAAELKRKTQEPATLEDDTRATLRRIPGDVFSSWRVQDEQNLLLFSDTGIDWHAVFAAPCPGLASATALSFVSPSGAPGSEYDSILLDDGTRCYFDRVIPTIIK